MPVSDEDYCLHGFDLPSQCPYCNKAQEQCFVTTYGHAYHSRSNCIALRKGQGEGTRGGRRGLPPETSTVGAQRGSREACQVCVNQVCYRCALHDCAECDPAESDLTTCVCASNGHR